MSNENVYLTAAVLANSVYHRSSEYKANIKVGTDVVVYDHLVQILPRQLHYHNVKKVKCQLYHDTKSDTAFLVVRGTHTLHNVLVDVASIVDYTYAVVENAAGTDVKEVERYCNESIQSAFQDVIEYAVSSSRLLNTIIDTSQSWKTLTKFAQSFTEVVRVSKDYVQNALSIVDKVVVQSIHICARRNLKLYICGHSLGGCLSQYFGALYNIPCISFNALGAAFLCSHVVVDHDRLGTVAHNLPPHPESVNFVVPFDVVARFGNNLFSQLHLGDVVPISTLDPGAYRNLYQSSVVVEEVHSMSRLLHFFLLVYAKDNDLRRAVNKLYIDVNRAQGDFHIDDHDNSSDSEDEEEAR